jgi:hypothetical protein
MAGAFSARDRRSVKALGRGWIRSLRVKVLSEVEV